MNTITPIKYTIEDLPVSSLTVDRDVQRSGFEMLKVERMRKAWDPNAVGIGTVSRRDTGELVILDGAHRHLVIKELTDNTGVFTCRVFEGLTRQEEAEIFLALNNTTQPTLLDKFRVLTIKGDADAVGINEAVRAYGWTITRIPGPHNLQAVKVLQRLWAMSKDLEIDPNLVSTTMLVITRAWGTEKAAGAGVLVEGIGRVLAEYRGKIDVEQMIDRLKEYRGGAKALHAEAAMLANSYRRKVSMCVAELVVEAYNRGRRPGSARTLARWSKRS